MALPKLNLPPWLLPLVGGLAIGWYFSGTISKVTNSIHLPIQGGNVGYSYPAQTTQKALSPSAAWPRRSFDREYSSWLEGSVNALPTIG